MTDPIDELNERSSKSHMDSYTERVLEQNFHAQPSARVADRLWILHYLGKRTIGDKGSHVRHYFLSRWGYKHAWCFEIRDEYKLLDRQTNQHRWRWKKALARLPLTELLAIQSNRLLDQAVEILSRTERARDDAEAAVLQELQAGVDADSRSAQARKRAGATPSPVEGSECPTPGEPEFQGSDVDLGEAEGTRGPLSPTRARPTPPSEGAIASDNVDYVAFPPGLPEQGTNAVKNNPAGRGQKIREEISELLAAPLAQPNPGESRDKLPQVGAGEKDELSRDCRTGEECDHCGERRWAVIAVSAVDGELVLCDECLPGDMEILGRRETVESAGAEAFEIEPMTEEQAAAAREAAKRFGEERQEQFERIVAAARNRTLTGCKACRNCGALPGMPNSPECSNAGGCERREQHELYTSEGRRLHCRACGEFFPVKVEEPDEEPPANVELSEEARAAIAKQAFQPVKWACAMGPNKGKEHGAQPDDVPNTCRHCKCELEWFPADDGGYWGQSDD